MYYYFQSPEFHYLKGITFWQLKLATIWLYLLDLELSLDNCHLAAMNLQIMTERGNIQKYIGRKMKVDRKIPLDVIIFAKI